MTLSAIDLFAGGGGLTVGLKEAGFTVAAAVEIEEHALATYESNHPEVKLVKRDITDVSGAYLKELTGLESVDLLAGCPPCQGFTSLNRYRKDDPRNNLILEMSRLAKELRPRAIMMENVHGLTTKGNHLYEKLKRKLEGELGYVLEEDVLEAADYGVPQRRRRLVLLGGLGFKIRIPKRTHSEKEESGLNRWKSVRETIGEMKPPLTLKEANAQNTVQPHWHVVRTLSQKNMDRIRVVEPGKNRSHIPEHLRPDCHKGIQKGFGNVYGRMEWDQPSPTITGGCTTFSKGRFGHPEANRTISVREAALLQTFPPGYIFDTPYMDYVCNIIGNALPCEFARVLSEQCYNEILAQADSPKRG